MGVRQQKNHALGLAEQVRAEENTDSGYWKKNPADADLFKRHSFLLSQSEDGTLYWRKPAQLCMDSPYLNTGLAELTGIHKKHVLWTAYKDKLNESQFTDFVGFLRAVGVMHGVSVSQASLHSNPKVQDLWKGLYGTRSTYTGISEDYSINALDNYTKLQSISLNPCSLSRKSSLTH